MCHSFSTTLTVLAVDVASIHSMQFHILEELLTACEAGTNGTGKHKYKGHIPYPIMFIFLTLVVICSRDLDWQALLPR